MRTTSDTYERVLKLLLDDNGIRGTARLLDMDPAQVSRIAKYWVRKGVLIKVSPPGVPATFVPGPNLPRGSTPTVDTDNSASTVDTDPTVGVGWLSQEIDFTPVVGGDPVPGFIPMRCHALGHRFKVISGPTKKVPWTRDSINSGVPTYVLEVPISPDPREEGIIKIVYREGTIKQSLDIWTPEVIITNPKALEVFPKWVGGRAQEIANWLSRKFGFKLGVVQLCQDFHIAAAVPKEVADAAKEIGLRTPDLWMDTSRGRGELETDEKKTAMNLMTLPSRVASLEAGIAPTLEKLVETQNQLVESHQSLLKFLEKLLGEEKPTSEPPPFDDTGRMFG